MKKYCKEWFEDIIHSSGELFRVARFQTDIIRKHVTSAPTKFFLSAHRPHLASTPSNTRESSDNQPSRRPQPFKPVESGAILKGPAYGIPQLRQTSSVLRCRPAQPGSSPPCPAHHLHHH